LDMGALVGALAAGIRPAVKIWHILPEKAVEAR